MSFQNLTGQTLGQYELRELLGVGGMGAVYRGFQASLSREVAVKVVSANLVQQAGYIERFNREAKTAAALEHAHIIPVYDYGAQEGITYVVMRLLTGGSLAERIAYMNDTGRPLPSLQEIADITRDLASALDYAHNKGVIHRDIKTSNVLFDNQGVAFIVDFGIAKLAHATVSLTGTGVAMGTPSYMAPEQWKGDVIGPAADQYALGVLVYAMLTGRMPFEGETPFQLMHKHMYEDPTPVNLWRRDLPGKVQQVLDRALAKDPTQRYPKIIDFARDFQAALSETSTQQPTGFFTTPLPRRAQPPVETPATSSEMDGPTVTPSTPARAATPAPPEAAAATAPSTPPAVSIPSEVAAEAPRIGQRRRALLIAGVLVAAILAIGSGIVLLTAGGDEQQAGRRHTATAIFDPVLEAQRLLTETARARQVAMAPTATDTPTLTDTPDNTATIAAILTQFAVGTAEVQTTTAEAFTDTPTITPTPTQTATPTATPTSSNTPTDTPTRTPSPTNTPTTTLTSTPLPTATLTHTPSPTLTPSNTPTETATATPTINRTATVVARATANAQATFQAQAALNAQSTNDALATLNAPTNTPEPTPTDTPTLTASRTPTHTPTHTATHTLTPSNTPTLTHTPTNTRTHTPTATPTYTPTLTPSRTPTLTPTLTPTRTPTSTSTPSSTPTPTANLRATFEAYATQAAQATQAMEAARATLDALAHAAQAPTSSPTTDLSATLAAAATRSAQATQTTGAVSSTLDAMILTVQASSPTSALSPTRALTQVAVTGMATTNQGVNVRGGPGTNFEIVATLPAQARVTILGTNAEGTWYNVRLTNGKRGWIRADLLLVVSLRTATPSFVTLTPTPFSVAAAPGFPPIAHNADWTPIEREFDGVAMVLVPAGCFMMGDDGGELNLQPAHRQCFHTPFWIDKYEVTNAQFTWFNGRAVEQSTWTDSSRPRERITWLEARDFCSRRNTRLPTEREWEYTARGPDALVYPWGNSLDAGNAVYLGNSRGQTAEVGSRSGGVSWVGALDMSGNVWEWVNTAYQFYPYEKNDGREGDGDSIVVRVVRGGSIGSTGDALRTSARGRFQASYQNSDTGFRCARDFDSGDIAAAPAEATPGFAPVTHNADWTTVEREFDGVAMVLVPAGCFMMGSEEGLLNERPVHQQCFDEPFWIDKTEVANAQFARFGGEAAFNTRWSDPNVPRERISWIEAHEFCVRRGARLPTEAEWEYAARGPDNLIYPWGDTFNEQYVVYGNNSSNHTAYVGSKPLGASWVGALDMSGNVWEWTSSIYRDYPYNAGDGRENSGDESSPRVLRGGSWFNRVEDLLRTTSRSYVIPEAMVDFNGFRCARSY